MKDFRVTVHGPRGNEWIQIAGTNVFPVKSPIPSVADLPGKPNAKVYLLDLGEMEVSVMDRILAHLAVKFGMTDVECQEELAKTGTIPILEDDCSLMILNPQRWL